MKNRSTLTIFTTILSVATCFGFAFGAPGPESPDPSPFPVNSNTADGFKAVKNSSNAFDSGFGWFSLFTNTSAFFNSGFGAATLFSNNGADNTAVGAAAMFFNTTGTDNTAVGINALRGDTTVFQTGINNNAIGASALFSNSTGSSNEAMGNSALGANTTSSFNTAMGDFALGALLTAGGTGGDNTAIGWHAGSLLTGAESGNVNIGSGAGGFTGLSGIIEIGGAFSGQNFCLLGTTPNGTGSLNVILGGGGSAVFIPGFPIVMASLPGTPGFIDNVALDPATGTLGDNPSSARFKKDIDPMGKTSEAIFSLRPVTFHYKNDTTKRPRFGLIAEDVTKVNPALVGVDKEGKPYCVSYQDINAMLLNEFLKEHKKVEEQQASISQLKSEMQTMVAQLKEQAAQIQKVSAQLEVNKPAPQVVANKP